MFLGPEGLHSGPETDGQLAEGVAELWVMQLLDSAGEQCVQPVALT